MTTTNQQQPAPAAPTGDKREAPVPFPHARIGGIYHSPTIAQISEAMAVAWAFFNHAKRGAQNDTLSTSYASHAEVIDAAKEALGANGLFPLHGVRSDGNGRATVTSVLLHKSGEWFATDVALMTREPGPQAMGSLITYGKRYGIAALLGIATKDDDAEAAMGRSRAAAEEQAQQQGKRGRKGTADDQPQREPPRETYHQILQKRAVEVLRQAFGTDRDVLRAKSKEYFGVERYEMFGGLTIVQLEHGIGTIHCVAAAAAGATTKGVAELAAGAQKATAEPAPEQAA